MAETVIGIITIMIMITMIIITTITIILMNCRGKGTTLPATSPNGRRRT